MVLALKIILFIDCLLLTLSVLLQKGEEAGLGSITGSSQSLFGNKRKSYYDVFLSRMTIVTGIIMPFLSIMVTLVQ